MARHLHAVPDTRRFHTNLPRVRAEIPMRDTQVVVLSSDSSCEIGAVFVHLGPVQMSLSADEALVLGESLAAAARHHKAAVAAAEALVS